MKSADEEARHVTELDIASYLDRALSGPDKDRFEDHLVECAECRKKVTAAQELVHGLRRPRGAPIVLGLIAIAAVSLFVVRLPRANDTSARERSAESSHAGTLVARDPIGDAVSVSERRRFVWSSAPDVVSYHLTLSTADGTTIWSNSGTDTVAALPATVEVRSGAEYAWVVDAITSDGSTLSTGMQHFRSR